MFERLDDVRFLADSRHRAVALATLAQGPQTRAALREATDASSATIGRVAQAFEARGWLTRDGSQYELTTLGHFVARSFFSLHDDMVLAHELDALLPYVPMDEIGIGVDRLTDAAVTHRTRANPFAVVSRVRELELASREARSLTDFFPEPCIDGRHEAIVNGTQSFEAVFAPIVIEAAMRSDAAEKFSAIVAADRTDVYLYDGEIHQPVMWHDGVGCIVVRDEDDISIGLIETDDETLVEWATRTFEAYRDDATLLAAEDLAGPLDELLTGT